jgi:hypothetical protein
MAFETRDLIRLAAVAIGAAVLIRNARAISEALLRLRGGGPPPPSHPLPGNDANLVLRKRTKGQQYW